MDSPLKKQLRQTAPFESVEAEVFLALRRVAQQALEPWSDYLSRHSELTHVQYNVLRILRGAGRTGLTTGGIAERMIERGCDATRLVDRLVKGDLVRRQDDPSDRRVVRVVITQAGLASLAELDAPATEIPKQVLGALGPQELLELRRLLNVLLEGGDSDR